MNVKCGMWGGVSFEAPKCRVSPWQVNTYLHDELNGANEEAQELEKHVLLLLLHLIETILLASLKHLLGCETNPGVGLDCASMLVCARKENNAKTGKNATYACPRG